MSFRGRMTYSPLFSTLLAFLLLSTCATASSETPREGKDKQDDEWLHFVTRPDIQAPKYGVHIYDKDALAPGYWFIAPYDNINKLKRGKPWEGPYIYDGHGELVWAGTPTMDYYMVNDFKIQRYNNTDMITAIMFRDNAALFLDNHYDIVKSVSWTEEWEHANMHEFHIVRDGTRALAITRNRWTNLTLEHSRTVGYEGNCSVSADGFKEIDITVDPPKILFEWIGIENLPLKESVLGRPLDKIEEACEKNWDIHHLNSVDKFADGDYLLSAKEPNTIYKINHTDGTVVWRLGGLLSDFHLSNKVKFEDQHTPRILNESESHLTLSLFANTSPKRSRGIIIRVNYDDKSVELLQEAHDMEPHPRLTVPTRGSAQLLPNGNMFTGWANWGRLSEHDANGKLLMFGHLKLDYLNKQGNRIASYRAYKFPWVAQPREPPAVYSAAFPSGTNGTMFVTRIFVSWNGATEVRRWRYYESNADGTALKPIDETKHKGFETNIRYEGLLEHVIVEALDESNQPIGRSPLIKTIFPVKGEPVALHSNTTILSCATNGFSGYHEPDADYDDAPYELVAEAVEPRLTDTIDSTSALAGFSACAGIWIAMSLWKRRSSFRRKGPKYHLVDAKDRESLFGGDEDDGEGDGVELKDQKRA